MGYQSCLHYIASNTDCTECADIFLDLVPNADVLTLTNETALMQAARSGHRTMVKYLLEKGASQTRFDTHSFKNALLWSADYSEPVPELLNPELMGLIDPSLGMNIVLWHYRNWKQCPEIFFEKGALVDQTDFR